MRRKKEIGLKIQFDEKEYSEEEMIFLYKHFFAFLFIANNEEINWEILEKMSKAFVIEIRKRG